MSTVQPSTFTGLLDRRASEQAEHVAYVWLGEGEEVLERLTFSELRRRALSVAARLSQLPARGERALIVLPQGLSFLAAFFGCLYAGVVPVPVSPPNRKRGLEIVRAIAVDSGASVLISSGALGEQLAADDEGLAALAQIDLFDWPKPPAGFQPAAIEPQSIALLQYTSGTTRSPRGVAVTHANLVANHRQVAACLNSDARTVYVSWLPMFHDMGLGIALSAVWAGACTVLMSPRSFFQEPLRWLRVISRYRATTSGGPNSAYALCLSRITPEERRQLDLSSWRVAFNGSEPVHTSTLRRFAEEFAEAGFDRAALHPVYGLAEATLLATSEPPGQGALVRHFSADALEEGRLHGHDTESGRARTLVSCGKPWPGTEIAIVAAGGSAELSPGCVGEVWIRGPSVAAGYWNRDAETRASFDLTTADGRRGFVRSGDLGVVDDDALFVLGRQSDVLAIHGRTYYPHDIETSSSSSYPDFVPHASAAFLLRRGGGHQLVIVQEVSRTALRQLNAAAAVDAIRRAVSQQHRLVVAAVALIKPATLPRTTSGKVRRAHCREAYEQGSLAVVHSWLHPTLNADGLMLTAL